MITLCCSHRDLVCAHQTLRAFPIICTPQLHLRSSCACTIRFSEPPRTQRGRLYGFCRTCLAISIYGPSIVVCAYWTRLTLTSTNTRVPHEDHRAVYMIPTCFTAFYLEQIACSMVTFVDERVLRLMGTTCPSHKPFAFASGSLKSFVVGEDRNVRITVAFRDKRAC